MKQAPEMAALSAEERLVLAEELALLERAQASLGAAASHQATGSNTSLGRANNTEVLRELRELAAAAPEDDLPSLLHEMSVRQQLLARPAEQPLPPADSPYIAHLRVHEQGQTKDYCLGQRTHLDGAAGVRIVDWRVAPVARIFYAYREGDQYEEEYPGRVAEGTVLARRIVVITGGALQQVVGDSFVLRRNVDGTWQSSARASYAIAPGGAGSAVRPDRLGGVRIAFGPSVTSLLDAQQFAAIAAPPEQALLVLGSAGSGKTTVALHRLARIATLHAQEYPASGVRVVVPEEGLARLSRRLLEPLGTEQTQVQTLDDWALERAASSFAVRLPRLSPETPAAVTSLKRHPALYRALSARFARAKAKAKPTSFRRLRRTLGELFTDREFLSSIVDDAEGSLPRAAIEETIRHTLLQQDDSLNRELSSVSDRSRLRTLDGRSIAEGTPDDVAQTVDVEELPILLALRELEQGFTSAQLSHLVLDEAEDFSLFEARVLGRDLREPKSVTLAGDADQQTSSSFAGFDETLTELGASDAEVCRLQISYRCPAPIFELAQRVLGPLAKEGRGAAARPGVPVGLYGFPTPEQAALFAAGAVRDLVHQEPEASIAVILHDAQDARRFFALLSSVPEARLVLEGQFSFEPGIDVTDLDSVKGLEFDYVVVPDATRHVYPETDEARRRLHVAITRAVSQLWLVWGGEPTLLIR